MYISSPNIVIVPEIFKINAKDARHRFIIEHKKIDEDWEALKEMQDKNEVINSLLKKFEIETKDLYKCFTIKADEKGAINIAVENEKLFYREELKAIGFMDSERLNTILKKLNEYCAVSLRIKSIITQVENFNVLLNPPLATSVTNEQVRYSWLLSRLLEIINNCMKMHGLLAIAIDEGLDKINEIPKKENMDKVKISEIQKEITAKQSVAKIVNELELYFAELAIRIIKFHPERQEKVSCNIDMKKLMETANYKPKRL